MALRLRRDVQKASYYVWFLGAEEARGLRGPRIINPVVPYLIERSRGQEPLKVTLQVSHKGIKILQGQSKHFIPHSAITSSVQIDDIVACVLLLYNPATKCPLHVHAYRCDSETTAEALHQQLQILVNRPENQKRFAELESRLGIAQNSVNPSATEQKRFPRRAELSPKRFESSLGSDTGTSTRESECSEENISSSPMSPVHKQRGDLFDSLAAELRAKLNGNGPPLLLPPRDYDTVHRSKGNLAAIELRRCRNSLIVGAKTNSAKQVSSRGSSGIGSDLAPSPERQDDHSSSEEENWLNEGENPIVSLKSNQMDPAVEKRRYDEHYLRDLPVRDYPRPANRNKDNYCNPQMWSPEDEIRPIIMRPPNYDSKFKRVLMDNSNKHYSEERLAEIEDAQMGRKENTAAPQNRKFCKYPDDVDHSKVDKLEKSFHNKLSLQQRQYDMYDYEFESEEEHIPQHENLTDRQKYQEVYSRRGRARISQKYENSPNKYGEDEELLDPPTKAQRRYHFSPEKHHPTPLDCYKVPTGKGDNSFKYNEKNPYKNSETLPYRESIEKMIKSPVIRYKSFDSDQGRHDYDNQMMMPRNVRNAYHHVPEKGEGERYEGDRRHPHSSSPDSSNTSPKERFQDAKEKFRAMEKMRLAAEQRPSKAHNAKEYHRRNSLEHSELLEPPSHENWSDEEHCVTSRDSRGIRCDYRKAEKRPEDAYVGITNSKSLSNLAKGYRHSYAEARPALPRNSGRVGLAAVNPF